MLVAIKSSTLRLRNSYLELSEPAKRLLTALTQTLLFLIPAILSAYRNRDRRRPLSSVMNQVISSLGGGYFLAGLFTPNLHNLTSAFRPYMPDFMITDNYATEYKQALENYYALEPKLTAKQKHRILLIISSYKNLLDRFIITGDDYNRDQAIKYKTQLDLIFKCLSRKSFNFSAESSVAQLNSLIDKIETVLATYNNKDEIKKEIIRPFLSNAITGGNLPARSIYLVGDPGVGKTKFVTGLAEVLGSSFLTVDFATLKQNAAFATYNEFKIEDANLITKARLKMHEENKSTCIIFFDELDKHLTPAVNQQPTYGSQGRSAVETVLLEMLNADLQLVHDSYLDIEIPMTNILIVAAGNKKLSAVNKDFSALESRFVTINFPRLDQELKTKIAFDHAYKNFLQANLSIDDEDKHALDLLVKQDANPGVRALKMTVEAYVGNKLGDSVFVGTLWDKAAILQAPAKHCVAPEDSLEPVGNEQLQSGMKFKHAYV